MYKIVSTTSVSFNAAEYKNINKADSISFEGSSSTNITWTVTNLTGCQAYNFTIGTAYSSNISVYNFTSSTYSIAVTLNVNGTTSNHVISGDVVDHVDSSEPYGLKIFNASGNVVLSSESFVPLEQYVDTVTNISGGGTTPSIPLPGLTSQNHGLKFIILYFFRLHDTATYGTNWSMSTQVPNIYNDYFTLTNSIGSAVDFKFFVFRIRS